MVIRSWGTSCVSGLSLVSWTVRPYLQEWLFLGEQVVMKGVHPMRWPLRPMAVSLSTSQPRSVHQDDSAMLFGTSSYQNCKPNNPLHSISYPVSMFCYSNTKSVDTPISSCWFLLSSFLGISLYNSFELTTRLLAGVESRSRRHSNLLHQPQTEFTTVHSKVHSVKTYICIGLIIMIENSMYSNKQVTQMLCRQDDLLNQPGS
jgi:hypothetical protein